jgi:microcin C transport system permease protein
MTRVLWRRLAAVIPTFLGATFAVFVLTRSLPGGPIDEWLLAAGQPAADHGMAPANLPEEVRAELRRQYRLDEPVLTAYAHWLGDLASGDLGRSYSYHEPVVDVIARRLPLTLYLGVLGFLVSYTLCVPLGMWKAVRHGTRFDWTTSALVFAAHAVPGWALGAVLLVLLGGGSFWDLFPLGGLRSPAWDDLSWPMRAWDQAHHTVLPVLAYTVGSFATLTMLVKTSVLDQLGQAYVRTATAKGIGAQRVLWVHVVRNALVPLVTGLGRTLSTLVAGSILVERVFNLDGIGYLAYTSVVGRDYAVVMGLLVLKTAFVIGGNLSADLLYLAVDPRIRLFR